MRFFITIFIFCLATFVNAQDDPFLKDLGIYSDGRSSNATKKSIDKLNETIRDTVYSNAEKAARYSKLSYKLSTDIEYYDGRVDALLNLSRAFVYSNKTDSALITTKLAIKIADNINSLDLKVKANEMLGGVYTHLGEYDKAADAYFETIRIAEKIDEKLTITSYANLGHVFKMVNNEVKSREYSNKGYELGKKYKDTAVMITSLNILGLLDKRQNKEDDALKRFQEGLEYARQTGNLERQSQILYNMSNIYFNRKDYDKGFELFDKSIEISKVNGSYMSTGVGFHSLAITYFEIGRYDEAKIAADSALHYALLSGNYELIMESYAVQCNVAESKNQLRKALEYLNLAYEYKDSLNFSQLNSAALDAEDQFEKEKQHIEDSLQSVHAEIERQANEQKVRSRENLLWVFLIIIILVVIGAYYLYKNNKVIKSQNMLVNEQKEEIQLQHNEIKDSINYAKRIQEAIISRDGEWRRISAEHFILFKPKDVVSGDYYWAHYDETKNLAVWAVADCTGHGVPGAFMSMLGIGFLNEIVVENGVVNPGEILNQLRSRVVSSLATENGERSKDGMDISLCVWDKNKNTLKYAGANNPLWLIRRGDFKEMEFVKKEHRSFDPDLALFEIAPDKMPIGDFLSVPPPFNTREITLMEGDIIVLLTDGFADQFGGEHGKKFKYTPFKDVLLKLDGISVSEYSTKLSGTFEKWRGAEDQVDDVCVVGVQITSI